MQPEECGWGARGQHPCGRFRCLRAATRGAHCRPPGPPLAFLCSGWASGPDTAQTRSATLPRQAKDNSRQVERPNLSTADTIVRKIPCTTLILGKGELFRAGSNAVPDLLQQHKAGGDAELVNTEVFHCGCHGGPPNFQRQQKHRIAERPSTEKAGDGTPRDVPPPACLGAR